MNTPRISSALLTLALLLAGSATAAGAQSLERPFSIEAALQRVGIDGQPLGNDQTLAPSVRAGYRFSERWAVEGQLSEAELIAGRGLGFIAIFPPPIGSGDLELMTADVSARYRLAERGRFALFALGGVGWLDVELPQPGLLTGDDAFTQHLGLASEIALGERIFLRPDVRYRWSDDLQLAYTDEALVLLGGPSRVDADLGLDFEAGLSVGWRL